MKIMRNAWFISIALLQSFNWFLSIAFTGIFVPTRDVQHTTKIDQNRYSTGYFAPTRFPPPMQRAFLPAIALPTANDPPCVHLRALPPVLKRSRIRL